jgi:hypothetical protein
LDLLADEAPLDPEKVHVVGLLAKSGAAVGSGAAAGAALTTVAATARERIDTRRTIIAFSTCTSCNRVENLIFV